jgi:peroxiredoxin Q/BCP
MRDDISKFEQAGAKIIVVGRHTPEEMAEYWKENNLPYMGIPDPDTKLGKLYKQQWKAMKLGLMPAMFVIGKNGKISFLHYSSSMKDIPENSKTLGEVQKLK